MTDEKGCAIIMEFKANRMVAALKTYNDDLPHAELLQKIEDKKVIKHIEDVVKHMYNLLYNRHDEVLNLNGTENSIDPNVHDVLKDIIVHFKEKDKYRLLYTALYHDIGKAVIKARHGPEGADIIKDSCLEDREKFYNLGLKRPDFFLISDLIKFHDYLGMAGTGEVSYLIFDEVLYPVSNLSLSRPMYAEKFLDYLLLLNLADIAGSSEEEVTNETFILLMHDFDVIKRAHNNISKTIYEKSFQKKVSDDDMCAVHKMTIPARNHNNIQSELQKLAEYHTSERLRRLLREGFKKLIKNNKFEGLTDYKAWMNEKYQEELQIYVKTPDEWFFRDYKEKKEELHDLFPIIASLRGINVKQEFYAKFAFFCKLDYMLGFLRELFETVITIEIEKKKEERKSPHDLRRDLAMTLVELINTLVGEFGDFTSNNTKIGLGFERFMEMYGPQKVEMLKRLAGERGNFKEVEALTKLRNSVVLWVITP
jgi:hypothetical protein